LHFEILLCAGRQREIFLYATYWDPAAGTVRPNLPGFSQWWDMAHLVWYGFNFKTANHHYLKQGDVSDSLVFRF